MDTYNRKCIVLATYTTDLPISGVCVTASNHYERSSEVTLSRFYASIEGTV